jgi:hypothetical protein
MVDFQGLKNNVFKVFVSRKTVNTGYLHLMKDQNQKEKVLWATLERETYQR